MQRRKGRGPGQASGVGPAEMPIAERQANLGNPGRHFFGSVLGGSNLGPLHALLQLLILWTLESTILFLFRSLVPSKQSPVWRVWRWVMW